jgi:hypothetical protein
MRAQVDGHIQLWDSRAANVPVMIFHQPASSSASAASTDVNALSFLPGGAFVTAHDDEFCRWWLWWCLGGGGGGGGGGGCFVYVRRGQSHELSFQSMGHAVFLCRWTVVSDM